MFKKFHFLLLFFGIVNWAHTQGIIQGKVTDLDTGEELIGATVRVRGEKAGAMVDINGMYRITNLTAGRYLIVCSYVSFRSDSAEVEVKDKEETVLNFTLSSSAITIDEFIVEGKADRKNEKYLLQERRKSASVVDIIGANEIAKKGDGDVAGAAKRITGLSIEGGKYVYVRGLSDRYSKTTINGAEVPGLDPNRNAVQMDLLPTSMIENMKVTKSFAPDLPGSFSGGLLNIETKDFPEKFMLQCAYSIGYNTLSSLNPLFLTHKGGKFDLLGWDDGSRDRPSQALKVPAMFTDNEKLETIGKSFSKEMDVSHKNSFLNQGFSLSAGNQTKFLGKELGFIAGLSYQLKYEHRDKDAFTNRYELNGSVQDVNELNPVRTLKDQYSQEYVLWGSVINLSYKLNSNNKLGFVFFRNQNGVKTTSFQSGEIPSDQIGLYFQTRALEYEENTLNSSQLKGEHHFEKLKKLNVNWMYAYSSSKQNQPDLRYFSNDYTINETSGDTTYNLQASIYPVPTRYYRKLNQGTHDAKLNFEFTLKEKEDRISIFKTGAAFLFQNRLFNESRYNYRAQGFLTYNGSVAEYLSDENMELPTPGNPVSDYIYIEDATERRNSYSADQSIYAGYVMGDFWTTKKLRIVTGARLETTDISVKSFDVDEKPGNLLNTDILPSLNSTYVISDNVNIRAAYSRTLARPTFREIAPFATYDFSTNWIIVGNPNLKRTLVDNIDLRFEFFPNHGEILSAGTFYKSFIDPIELVFNTQAQNSELTWRNIGQATVYGAELEAKKQIGFLSDSIRHYFIGCNFTYVYSKVGIDAQEIELIQAVDPGAPSTRAFFGQSPYIVNANLEFRHDSAGLTTNLSYNVSGEKIAVVVLGATPDVYEQPFHQLDLNVGKKLGKRFTLSFKAQNILNATIKRTYTYKDKEYIFNSYKKGITFTFGLRYLLN